MGLGPSFSLVADEVEWYEGETSVAMGDLSMLEEEASRRSALEEWVLVIVQQRVS